MATHRGISVFYLSSDCSEWANYIKHKLSSAPYKIGTELNDLACHPDFHIFSSVLNVVFFTPDCLAEKHWKMLQQFRNLRSMGVLAGVEYLDIEKLARLTHCEHVLGWLNYELDATETSVRDLIVSIIGKYELNDSREAAEEVPDVQSSKRPVSDESEGVYDVLPDKNRQVNKVVDVLHNENDVYLLLERSAEGMLRVEVNGQEQIIKYQEGMAVYKLPYTDAMVGGTVSVTMDDSNIGKCNLKRQTSEFDSELEPTELNASKSQSEESQVKCDRSEQSVKKNKYEIIKDLLRDETDPELFLCECLGIDLETRRFDKKMTTMLDAAESSESCSTRKDDEDNNNAPPPSTWPTLLHFAAHYNLVNFCDALLNHPDMHDACMTRNNSGLCASDVARVNGHEELALMLDHYIEFVKEEKDGKYDSGFPNSLRLSSEDSAGEDNPELTPPPPRAHPKRKSVGGYAHIDDQVLGSEQHGDSSTLTRPRNGRSMSVDQGEHRHSSNLDNEEEETARTDLDSSLTREVSQGGVDDIFGPMMAYSPQSPQYVGSQEKDADGVEHQRQHNSNMLGKNTTPEANLSSSQKQNGFFKRMFRQKKSRSNSEPCISNDVLAQLGKQQRREKTKSYRRGNTDSQRSSSASQSSGNSVQSDPASRTSIVLEQEEEAHATDSLMASSSSEAQKKNRNKWKVFMKHTEKRKSIRIKHALEAQHNTAPSLPPRTHHMTF